MSSARKIGTVVGTEGVKASMSGTSGSTRPDIQAKRDLAAGKKYSAKARAHARATELEARARRLTEMIAGLDEERTKALIESVVLRLANR